MCYWCEGRAAAVLVAGYPTCGRCYFVRKRRRRPAMTLLIGGAAPLVAQPTDTPRANSA